MVKRYDPSARYAGAGEYVGGVTADADGDFVLYEDYKALALKLHSCEATMQRDREESQLALDKWAADFKAQALRLDALTTERNELRTQYNADVVRERDRGDELDEKLPDARRRLRAISDLIGRQDIAEMYTMSELLTKLSDLVVERQEPLSDAPCSQCGYNGPGYYQPETHSCASVEDGFGGRWRQCGRPDCGLQVVRPGKVQCDRCESE